MDDEPPTRITSAIGSSFKETSASLSASVTYSMHLSRIGYISSSSFSLVKTTVSESTSILASISFDRVFLAYSHDSMSLAQALGLPTKSGSWVFNSSMQQSKISLSMSRPPRSESPLVAATLSIPSEMIRTVTSNVPPPKSNIRRLRDSSLGPKRILSEQANAAAVGSLIMRNTSKPAILAASFVAYFYQALKQAGTVMTAFLTIHLA